MTQRAYVILFLLLYVAANSVGDFFSKKWTLTSASWMLIVAVMFYAVNTATWFSLLRVNSHLGKMATAWQMAGLVVAIVLSQFVFHEPMTWTSWAAVVLGICSLFMAML